MPSLVKIQSNVAFIGYLISSQSSFRKCQSVAILFDFLSCPSLHPVIFFNRLLLLLGDSVARLPIKIAQGFDLSEVDLVLSNMLQQRSNLLVCDGMSF